MFVTQESEKHSAVLNLRKTRTSSGSSTDTTGNKQRVMSTTNDLDLIDKRRPPVFISINLSFNNISDDNGSAFVRSLCRSIVATHVSLAGTAGRRERGSLLLFFFLVLLLLSLFVLFCQCITEIDLRGNCIGEHGMKMILDALQVNTPVAVVSVTVVSVIVVSVTVVPLVCVLH